MLKRKFVHCLSYICILFGLCTIPAWAQGFDVNSVNEESEKNTALKKKQAALELCLSMVKTAMEKAYCQIKAADANARLQPFSDFRRNPEVTQALLLKRPAKKAGITLPQVSVKRKKPAKVGRPGAKVVRNTSSKTPAKKGIGSTDTAFNNGLAGCVLKPASIVCGEQHFDLQLNLNNAKINQQMLADTHLLSFPIEPETFVSEPEKRRYLWRCYQIYIDKMTAIGLSASTVPFTKFYYMYEEGKSQKVLFNERFEKTFKFLKRDKQNLAVRARYSSEVPKDLSQCSALMSDYIVCDKGAINWVYKNVEL